MDEHVYPKMDKALGNAAWLVWITSFGYGTQPHYPAYDVREELIGAADSLYGARAIIDSAVSEQKGDPLEPTYPDECSIHHFTIRAIGKGACQFPLRPLSEYLYDRTGKPLDRTCENGNECRGRYPSEIRFRVGEVCEVMKEGNIILGIIIGVPPNGEAVEIYLQGPSGEPEDMTDYYDVLTKEGDCYSVHSYSAMKVFSPRLAVHPSTRARLSRAYSEYRSRHVRLAIEDRTCVEILSEMFARLGLEQDFEGQYSMWPGEVMARFTHDPLSREANGPTAALRVNVKALLTHPGYIEKGIRRALGERVGRGGRRLVLVYDHSGYNSEINIGRVYRI